MEIEIQFKNQTVSNVNQNFIISSTNSLNSENEQQQNQDDQNLKLVPLKVHKQILKSRKNPLKGYVKKIFEMVPILPKQLSLNHKYLLFGYQEVETIYKDYSNPFDFDLIDSSGALVEFQSVERFLIKDEIQINFNCKGCSGITDFNFLIDHFRKNTLADYQKLCTELTKYQVIAQQQTEHLKYLKMKLDLKLIIEEELQQANQNFLNYVEEYTKDQYQQGYYFYTYQLFTIDVKNLDIKFDRKSISLAILSLIGIEPTQYEQLIIHQGSGFQSTLGKNRLQDLLEILDIFTNGNNFKFCDTHLKTFDNIKIPVKEMLEVVYWEGRPSWASKYDYIMLFSKFDLSADRIKQVLDIRQKREKIELDPDIAEILTIDYVIQSEIFLEKFYPDLFQDLRSKKSIQLKRKQEQQLYKEIYIE